MSERSRYAAYDMSVKEGREIRNFFQIMLTVYGYDLGGH